MNNHSNNTCDNVGKDLKLQGFKAYEVGHSINSIPSYSRRDFFKVCISTGKNRIQYANRGIETDGTILFFGNPHIPYSWDVISIEHTVYACLFTEMFLGTTKSESLHNSPFFRIGGTPIYYVNEEQRLFLNSIFEKMIAEQSSDYVYKEEMMRNYINMITHEALKLEPSDHYYQFQNASSRITSMFIELLERQFPIESSSDPLRLKSPQDYANQLSVHVNHLNRSVKETTGKPTSHHIAERLVTEARSLLTHTDWPIADIGYALGFEYSTYFNNFYKKYTGETPRASRSKVV
ncbi:MAG: AraC family transcriptional regulator [Rickettsiales bacterium]|nr:AraC family transcriptional regulator [Rickettsiales bacterium]